MYLAATELRCPYLRIRIGYSILQRTCNIEEQFLALHRAGCIRSGFDPRDALKKCPPPKLIQPHRRRAYTARMSQEPATPHKYAALSLEQMVGSFLAKLYGWLIRCHASGASFVPADIAQHVTKADALVHAFIRSRAAAQLEYAGYTDAARAMRVPNCSRDASHRIEPAQGCHAEQISRRYERSEGAAGPSSRGTCASKQNRTAPSKTKNAPEIPLRR